MEYKYIDEDEFNLEFLRMHRVLSPSGKLLTPTFKPTLSTKRILDAYEGMLLSREFDRFLYNLYGQKKIRNFISNLGEEALQVAIGISIKKTDWFIPSFRSGATLLTLDLPLVKLLLYWQGNEMGSHIPDGINVLPINFPIATQVSHAVGIAYGIKASKSKDVAIVSVGNGETSKGEFYESLNIAAVKGLPIVFCINNNQWSDSAREEVSYSSKTLASKSTAFNIVGVRVDGNDLLACLEVMEEVVKYARDNSKPILVEFITWREKGHDAIDNARLYRTIEQEKEAEKWEPFHRIEKYLFDNKILTESIKEKLQTKIDKNITKAYKESISLLDVPIDDIFQYNYDNMDNELETQKNKAKKNNKGGQI